jgi:transcriptional regulator with XRE-family HTH domain
MIPNPGWKPYGERMIPSPMGVGAVFAASRIAKTLLQKLRKKPYRDAYVVEHVRQGIAHQIRALRAQRGWKQGKLGQMLRKPQSVVSRLEDPSYGKVTIQTLLELASVFDVALQVRFISYSSFLQQTRDLAISSMKVAGFNKDVGMLTHSAIFRSPLTGGQPEERIYVPDVNAQNSVSMRFLPASPPGTSGAVYDH